MVNYCEAYGTHASHGTLFNHEPPRRGPPLSRAGVTRAVAHIHLGIQQTLVPGNLDATRDWRDALNECPRKSYGDDVQQPQADDFGIATGKGLSVRVRVATIRETETRHTGAAPSVRVCPCCCSHGEIRN